MRNPQPAQAQLNGTDYAIIGLAIATALIHCSLLFPDPVFILNGLGYVALTAALYAPLLAIQRGTIRWMLMGYTALTIMLWLLIGSRTPLAYLDKVIEVVLLTLLWQQGQRAVGK
jgi:hypothetical protein